jgi:hypothetical protein
MEYSICLEMRSYRGGVAGEEAIGAARAEADPNVRSAPCPGGRHNRRIVRRHDL